MKKPIFLFFILFSVFSYSQVRDSVKLLDPLPVQKKLKSGFHNKEILKIEKMEDLIVLNPKVVIPKILIDKKLLDSLLKPYYTVIYDSVKKDTVFTPKYRMVVNEITNDTSYVVKPRERKSIAVTRRFRIDTLVIPQQVKQISVNRIKRVEDPVWWKNENSIGLDINEVAFINWSAGGQNAISGLAKVNFNRTYENPNILWESNIKLRYGINAQEDKGVQKTDDEIRINSTFGYKNDINSNWYYTMKFNFHTQFTNGYKYPDTDNPISRFFAPAYLFFGAGAQYNLKDSHLTLYLSPLTFKSTFVFDDKLSEEGAFGVEKGKRTRMEFGTLIQAGWDVEVVKNIAMSNKLSIYTDYLNNFGNIDVDWRLLFKFKINKYFTANFGTHLIYDDDIKYKEVDEDGNIITLGARVQFKQHLAIGVVFNF